MPAHECFCAVCGPKMNEEGSQVGATGDEEMKGGNHCSKVTEELVKVCYSLMADTEITEKSIVESKAYKELQAQTEEVLSGYNQVCVE